MNKIYMSSFLFLSILIACNNFPVNNNDKLKPGRRDYEWTLDTLKAAPGNWYYLNKIWGNSPDDIWAAGTGDAGYTLWHFDGKMWERYKKWTRGFLGLWGFAHDDIWACGGEQIYHYDGNTWTLKNTFSLPGYMGVSFNDLWGESPEKLYVVGSASTENVYISKGVILEYNGNTGRFIDLPELPVTFGRIRKDKNDNYFLIALRVGGGVPDSNKIFLYNSGSFKELWSGIELVNINILNREAFISIHKKIYKYYNNRLIQWKDFSSTSFLSGLKGRNENDFFCVSKNGLSHFNGRDLVTIYPTDIFINYILLFERDVFVLAGDKIIIHGKLKN